MFYSTLDEEENRVAVREAADQLLRACHANWDLIPEVVRSDARALRKVLDSTR